MKSVFEKIIERLEEYLFEKYCVEGDAKIAEIVNQVAEEYGDGWIPCSERLPSNVDFVLYTHKDGEVDVCSIEYFYDYLDRFTAWQPLPESYQLKESAKWKKHTMSRFEKVE